MHEKKIIAAGSPVTKESRVLIMLHGRGAGAYDILSIAEYLNVKDFTLLAPQATNNSWYPFSFLSPPQKNEPWLSSAISLISDIIGELEYQEVSKNKIYLLGFSQGACLALEYAARHAFRYGGIVAFTGGLIGDKIYNENYSGNFEETPVFIGCSDHDPHIPVERVYSSTNILKKKNAMVTEKIYPNMAHTIIQDEIEMVNRLIFP